jgi:hypothetical protein
MGPRKVHGPISLRLEISHQTPIAGLDVVFSRRALLRSFADEEMLPDLCGAARLQ